MSTSNQLIGTETTRDYSASVLILMEHMPRKHTRQCFLHKFRRAIMILLLSVSAGLVLPHKADSQENREQCWKHAEEVVFSGDKGVYDLRRAYPFLKGDFQDVDASAPVRIAESLDKTTGINMFFVSTQGPLYCGSHGCSLDVYVDRGAGFRKALSVVAYDPVHISRADGQISLFFGSDNNGKIPLEWILKGNSFEANRPR
ncbi:MAG: hypothetical protein WA993_09525 [Candidatus Binatus sp.]|jgi:hypothetical protein